MKLRSLLFVPADSERKFAKASGIGADALILDLEDSVAGARKDAGRALTAEFLKTRAAASRKSKLFADPAAGDYHIAPFHHSLLGTKRGRAASST